MKGFLTLFLFCISSVITISATEQAEEIFKKLAPSLYQIRLIDKASGEKSSIGSGFQISEEGLIATNYHVISGFALHPDKYDIEYLDNSGAKGKLDLKSVDIVNDLALVIREVPENMAYFELSSHSPTKGEEIYSLGNPHDLGMIVVPGTYNGLKNDSFNDRVHFTGSINPGMSGGPVVNKQSQVVGVNVATSGNQIGFLVPHDKLVNLYQRYLTDEATSIESQMQEQLSQFQYDLIDTVLSADWQSKPLGNALIPTIDLPFIHCWGESNSDKSEALILTAVSTCSLEEDTYISSKFYTGSIDLDFRYLQAKNLSASKFYFLYQQRIQGYIAGNKASKEDVSEYQCHHDTVEPNDTNINNKTIFCTRAYKKFPKLFDVLFLSASIDKDEQAIISHFTLSGVQEDSALAFTQKFMESVTWK